MYLSTASYPSVEGSSSSSNAIVTISRYSLDAFFFYTITWNVMGNRLFLQQPSDSATPSVKFEK